MWAAIRYRPAQALAMLALSALITTCAVFAPLYERALEQSLLLEGLNRYGPVQTAMILEAASVRDVPPKPGQPRSLFPPELAGLYDGGSDLWSARVRYAGVARSDSSITLLGPQVPCRSLQLVSGACPTKPFDVAVSEAEAKVQGWSLGASLTAVEDLPPGTSSAPLPQPFVVTGFFRQQDDPGHWTGFALEGRAGRTAPGPADTPLMDGWVTPESTFTSAWKNARVQVTYLLDRDAVSLERLASIGSAVGQMTGAGASMIPSVSVRSNVGDLITGVVEGQRQAQVIVPLMMGQLAILAVVVLGLVASAAVEQRRPELALGRLRGRGPPGVARMVMAELGTVVAVGVPAGFVLALLLGALARAVWLTPGVPAELPASTVVAAAASLVAALLAVALVARPTLREPISTLLRRVPPRRRGWSVGVLDIIVIVLAAAGVVTLASGNLSGPLALATPTLLALALGLLLAHLLVPLADLLARRMTVRGNLVGGLTAVQVARRPAVRRIMAIITVATALTVFATDAVVVGQRNRADRARVETGAEAVLSTNASDITTLMSAVAKADPSGRIATPVVTIRQGSSSAMTTLAVIPDQFAAIAEFPRQQDQFDWAPIARTPPSDVIVSGGSLSVSLSDVNVKLEELGAPDDQPTTVSFVVFLAPPGNAPFSLKMGDLDPLHPQPTTFTQPIACEKGCRVAGFGISTPPRFQSLLRGTFTVRSVSVDGGPPAKVGDVNRWLPSGQPNAPKEQLLDYAKPIDVGSATAIGLELQTQRSDVQISSTGTSAAVPALVAGSLPVGSTGSAFQAAGLDGITLAMSQVGRLPYVPGGGADEAVVALDALSQRATSLSATATRQVWVTDPSAVTRISAALAAADIDVTAVELRADQQELYDNSASAWGLRLALVVGIGALVIALLVLVLVAATSWRSRARDYAALRMAGVKASTLRRVGLAEQLTVVVVSVVVGVACGVIGAQLAMPIVPFFTVPSTTFPVDTAPAVLPIVLASLAALVALVVTGAVVGIRLAGQASLQRIREQL